MTDAAASSDSNDRIDNKVLIHGGQLEQSCEISHDALSISPRITELRGGIPCQGIQCSDTLI